jgi:hypothetical protein
MASTKLMKPRGRNRGVTLRARAETSLMNIQTATDSGQDGPENGETECACEMDRFSWPP